METITLIVVAALSPALWQNFPSLLELIFKRKAKARAEKESETVEFRKYLITTNKTLLDINNVLQTQVTSAIEGNKKLSEQLSALKKELDETIVLLNQKDETIVNLTIEVNKLKTEIEILNGLLKK